MVAGTRPHDCPGGLLFGSHNWLSSHSEIHHGDSIPSTSVRVRLPSFYSDHGTVLGSRYRRRPGRRGAACCALRRWPLRLTARPGPRSAGPPSACGVRLRPPVLACSANASPRVRVRVARGDELRDIRWVSHSRSSATTNFAFAAVNDIRLSSTSDLAPSERGLASARSVLVCRECVVARFRCCPSTRAPESRRRTCSLPLRLR